MRSSASGHGNAPQERASGWVATPVPAPVSVWLVWPAPARARISLLYLGRRRPAQSVPVRRHVGEPGMLTGSDKCRYGARSSRGFDKDMYAGDYPMGLSVERSLSEYPGVLLRDHVWPKFHRENAVRMFESELSR